MREFFFPIVESLKKGLRRDKNKGRGLDELSECKNMVPTPIGLVSPTTLTRVFSGETIEHPFPQLMKGRSTHLFGWKSGIYTVDPSDWSKTLEPSFNPTTEASETITVGGPWHRADFYDAYFLFNGVCNVFKTNRNAMTGGSEKLYVNKTISVNTGCNFMESLVIGGFDPSNFWTSAWTTFWTGLADDNAHGIDTSSLDMKSNFVFWSCPGGGGTLFPLLETLGEEGYTTGSYYKDGTANRDFILDWIKREDGYDWAPVPWKGTVQKLLPLGKNLIVYGDEGIAVMRRVTSPISTFSMERIADFGIPSRGAAGGSDEGHVFIDTTGKLWSIHPNLELKRHGYSEFFAPMMGREIIIERSDEAKESYVCDGTKCYVMRDGGGLYEQTDALPTSVMFFDGGHEYIGQGDVSTTMTAKTMPFDMGFSPQKTITQIDLFYNNLTSVKARVWYRYEKGGSWVALPWQSVNDFGVVNPNIAGIEFQVEVTGTDAGDGSFDEMQVHYKSHDRRLVRGALRPEMKSR